jgi:magnesium-transporting ATPase (P-type)
MVTGDNIHTAIAIAKESEILPTNYVRPDPNKEDERGKYIVMDGKTFRTLTEGLVKDEVDEQKWHVKNK